MADDREALKRLEALAAYRQMDPKRRSVNALWRQFVEQNRQGITVPTTTRPKLHMWAREDRWNETLADEERQRQEATRQALLADRLSQVHKLHTMLPIANEALIDLLKNCDEPSVKLRAVFGLLDRLGFVAESRTATRSRLLDEASAEGAPKAEPVVEPDDDASEADWTQYLLKQAESQPDRM